MLGVRRYTGLYHAQMAPTQWSEVDGAYLGMGKQGVPMRLDDPKDIRYTEMSIWDIHRTQAPLVALLKPDVSRNIVRSLVGMMKEGETPHGRP